MPVIQRSLADPIIFTAALLEGIANRFVFEPMGLTTASGKILRLLYEKGALTPGALLTLTGGTKSNVSQRLNFLERKRLISRKYAAEKGDKRKVVVALTAAGRKKFEEIHGRLRKAKLELEHHFSKQEIERHFAFFRKLTALIEATNERCLKELFRG